MFSFKASDLPSTSRLLVGIVTICKNAREWELLNEQVIALSKKHGQLKQAITKMVQVVMEFLDKTPNLESKLALIETLRTVTEGKVCVPSDGHVLTNTNQELVRSLLKWRERG